MRAEVLLLDLRLRRRLLLGYTLGMALYTLVVVVLYPQFKDAASLDQFGGSAAAALFGVTGSLTSPAGWLDGNIYQNFLPLVMLLMTIGYGASCVAGQDEEGTLSLAVTLPLTRRGVLLQKVAALGIQAAVLAARDHDVRARRSRFRAVDQRRRPRRDQPRRRPARLRLRAAGAGGRLLDRQPGPGARRRRVVSPPPPIS